MLNKDEMKTYRERAQKLDDFCAAHLIKYYVSKGMYEFIDSGKIYRVYFHKLESTVDNTRAVNNIINIKVKSKYDLIKVYSKVKGVKYNEI